MSVICDPFSHNLSVRPSSATIRPSFTLLSVAMLRCVLRFWSSCIPVSMLFRFHGFSIAACHEVIKCDGYKTVTQSFTYGTLYALLISHGKHGSSAGSHSVPRQPEVSSSVRPSARGLAIRPSVSQRSCSLSVRHLEVSSSVRPSVRGFVIRPSVSQLSRRSVRPSARGLVIRPSVSQRFCSLSVCHLEVS